MLSIYPACFFHDEDGYSVVFPDLNWLSTCGDTLEEAMHMAVDCLAGYLYMEEKFKNQLPTPSRVEEIDIEKSVKKTLSIPVWLNKAALEQNINFSQVLQEALIGRLTALSIK